MKHLKQFFNAKVNQGLGLFIAALLLIFASCRKEPVNSNTAAKVNPNMSASGYSKPATITWLPVGPAVNAERGGRGSGKLSAFAKDPTNTILLIGGDNGGPGIHRSTDGGKTWTTANRGLTTADGLVDGAIHGLCFLPGQTQIALAISAGFIYRSTDGGQSWAMVYSSGASGGGDIFGFSGNIVFAAAKTGLIRSTDGGSTWTTDIAGNASTVTPSGLILASVSVSGGSYLYKYANNAWTQLAKLDASARQIAVRPDSSNYIYAALNDGSYDQALWASVDNGVTFSKVNFDTGLGTQSIAFSKVFPHRLWLEGDVSGEYTDDPRGQLNPTYTKLGTGLDTRYLYLEPNAAKTDDRGWFISDQGIHSVENMSTMTNYTSYNNGLFTNLVTGFAVSSDGQNVVAAIQDYSGARSNDGGNTWQLTSIGEDGSVAFAPNNPKLCYFMNGAFYVSQDAGVNFTQKTTMSGPTYQFQRIAFDPINPSTIYLATGSSTTGFQVSHDAGQTFAATNWQTGGNALSVAVDPKNNQHILMAGSQYGYVTNDGGTTISQITGLPSSGNILFAVNPRDSKSVTIAIDAGGIVSVYLSSDGGSSCTLSYQLPVGSGLRALSFNPAAPASKNPALVVATYSATYISGDIGKTWERLDVSTITHRVTGVQWLNNTLYLSTYGQGIIKTSVAMQ